MGKGFMKSSTKEKRAARKMAYKTAKPVIAKKKSSAGPSKKGKKVNQNEVAHMAMMDKIHHDVRMYALKALTPDEKREKEAERAVKLGAAPKKREYVNYKVLMEQKKKAKLELEERRKNQRDQGDLVDSLKKKSRNTKVKTVFWTDKMKVQTFGQIGRYSNGVLKLSKKDLGR